MSLVMLDTNILVDFVLIYLKQDREQKLPPSLRTSFRLLKMYESSTFVNVMSSWNKLELRDVLMQLRLQEKWILSGYTVKEFGDAKKEINLSKEEKEGVNQTVSEIWKNSDRKTISYTSSDRLKIERLNRTGFSYMDILLIFQAEILGCKYFVTRDKSLQNNNILSKEFMIKIVGIREFIDRLTG